MHYSAAVRCGAALKLFVCCMLSRCWDSATWETWSVGPGRPLSCRRRLFSTRCNIHLALMLMSVSICLSVCLWRKCIVVTCTVHAARGEGSSRAMLATARPSSLTGYSRRRRQKIGWADSVDFSPAAARLLVKCVAADVEGLHVDMTAQAYVFHLLFTLKLRPHLPNQTKYGFNMGWQIAT